MEVYWATYYTVYLENIISPRVIIIVLGNSNLCKDIFLCVFALKQIPNMSFSSYDSYGVISIPFFLGHVIHWKSLPIQSRPPFAGFGEVHSRYLIFVSFPHLLLSFWQSDHSIQTDHDPSMDPSATQRSISATEFAEI